MARHAGAPSVHPCPHATAPAPIHGDMVQKMTIAVSVELYLDRQFDLQWDPVRAFGVAVCLGMG